MEDGLISVTYTVPEQPLPFLAVKQIRAGLRRALSNYTGTVAASAVTHHTKEICFHRSKDGHLIRMVVAIFVSSEINRLSEVWFKLLFY